MLGALPNAGASRVAWVRQEGFSRFEFDGVSPAPGEDIEHEKSEQVGRSGVAHGAVCLGDRGGCGNPWRCAGARRSGWRTSEGSRAGKGRVRTCRPRAPPSHIKKKSEHTNYM